MNFPLMSFDTEMNQVKGAACLHLIVQHTDMNKIEFSDKVGLFMHVI